MANYVGELITEVRRDTDNTDFTVDGTGALTSGISTEDFLRYMNFGLMRLQGLIIQQNSSLFRRSQDFNVTAGQQQYTITDNVFLKESLIDVQYSPTGLEQDFREIREVGESYRWSSTSSFIHSYFRRSGSLHVSPVPATTQGKLRVLYYRALDRLDIRRGQLTAVTVAGGIITANTLTANTGTDDSGKLFGMTDQYICLCTKDGVSKTYNIPFTVYNPGSGLFTHPAFTLGTGETAAIGDYITAGKYTTTHLSELDSPNIERYLQLYTMVKIFRRDSSNDSGEAARELAAVEEEILQSYQGIQTDEGNIQISDKYLFNFDNF